MTTTEFQQQVAYQRALEGELAKTLQAMNGVRPRSCTWRMPKDEVFATDAGQAHRVRAARPAAGHHPGPGARSGR